MCGVIGVVSNSAANQLLYDGLMVLQHRGQDAAGIVTAEESRFHMHKGQGLARDVFRTRDMRNLLGDMGVAHVRYPTADSALVGGGSSSSNSGSTITASRVSATAPIRRRRARRVRSFSLL
ncbi:MAG TPA: hypothetical protein VF501_07530, partial [Thiobacillus sp.]